MEVEEYFFDTYAFHEIIKGNSNYANFLVHKAVATTRLNLMELYFGLLKEFDEKTAEKHFERFREHCIEFDDYIIKEAMKFKLFHKKKDFSYVDCIGYLIAKTKGIKFLTGDNAFKEMENVEFVK